MGYKLLYMTVIIYNDDNIRNYTEYLHRAPGTPCEEMTHKENLDQILNYF